MMGYILFLVVVIVLVMQKGSGSINNRKKHMKKKTNRAWYDISTEDLIDYDMFFDD